MEDIRSLIGKTTAFVEIMAKFRSAVLEECQINRMSVYKVLRTRAHNNVDL